MNRTRDFSLQSSRFTAIEQWIAAAMVVLPSLIISINTYDSAILKLPVLVALTSLFIAVRVARLLRTGSLVIELGAADIPLLAYVALILASYLFQQSWPQTHQTLLLSLSSAVCFHVGFQCFRDTKGDSFFSNNLAVLSLIASTLAAYQLTAGDTRSVNFFTGPENRVMATFGNSLFFSGFLVAAVPVVLSQSLIPQRKGRYLFAILAAVMVLLLFATRSRGSTVAGVFSLLLFWFGMQTIGKRKRWIGALVLGAILVALIATPGMQERFVRAFEFSPSSTFARRVVFWEASWKAFLSSPFVGHGLGSCETVMRAHRTPEYWVVKSEDVIPHAHNELLEVAVDQGIVGALSLLALVVIALRSGVSSLKNGSPSTRLTSLGFMCGVIAVMVDNVTSLSLRQPPIAALSWMMMGMLIARSDGKEPAHVFALKSAIGRRAWFVPLTVWLGVMVVYGYHTTHKVQADGHLLRGIFAHAADKKDKAIVESNQALALDPENIKALETLSLALLQSGRAGESLETVRRLKSLTTSYPKSNLVESLALMSLGMFDEARLAIDRELVLRDHPESWHIKAMVCEQLRDTSCMGMTAQQIITQSMRGNIAVEIGYAGETLAALARNREEQREVRELLGRAQSMFPIETGLTPVMMRLDSLMSVQPRTSRAPQPE